MDTMNWIDFVGWVAIPFAGILGGLLWYHIRDDRTRFDEIVREASRVIGASRQELSDYKLAVANTYASQGYLRDVEIRLIGALTKIEEKLDRVIEGKIHANL